MADHLPELGPLTWEESTAPRSTLLPDEQTGEAYKAELALFKTDTRTVKINRWFDDDERDGKGTSALARVW